MKYLTREELIAKIQDIEWDDFEGKTSKTELPADIWRTVSAFSNTSGGWILCGVAQHGKKFDIEGVEDGERIAQMVIARHEQGCFEEVDVLDETERGAGGYGHTGVK